MGLPGRGRRIRFRQQNTGVTVRSSLIRIKLGRSLAAPATRPVRLVRKPSSPRSADTISAPFAGLRRTLHPCRVPSSGVASGARPSVRARCPLPGRRAVN